MAEEKIESTEVPQKTRRAFVKTAAQVAVTAPAVAVLLSSAAKAQVTPVYLGDDFGRVQFIDDGCANDGCFTTTGDDFGSIQPPGGAP